MSYRDRKYYLLFLISWLQNKVIQIIQHPLHNLILLHLFCNLILVVFERNWCKAVKHSNLNLLFIFIFKCKFTDYFATKICFKKIDIFKVHLKYSVIFKKPKTFKSLTKLSNLLLSIISLHVINLSYNNGLCFGFLFG